MPNVLSKNVNIFCYFSMPVPTVKPPRTLGPGIIKKGSTDALLNSIVQTYHSQEGRSYKPVHKKSSKYYISTKYYTPSVFNN